MNAQQYQRFCDYLESQCGIVLGASKQYLVNSRLTPLVREFSLDDVGQLIDKVVQSFDQKLSASVVDAMTTNETQWFRDRYPFEILTNKLIPEIQQRKGSIKIWSAACSSGQEPYSIAMLVAEAKRLRSGLKANVQITATDISPSMLEHCRNARYDSLSLARGLTDKYRRDFFEDNML